MTSPAPHYRIGKVVAVTGDQIVVSLIDFDNDEPPSGVPASMTVDIPSAAGPSPLLIGQPGTFVMVSLPSGFLLCMVTGIEMKEERISTAEVKQAGQEALALLDRVSRGLSTVPVGTLDTKGAFERGTDTMPTVNAPVFAVDAQTIDSIYAGYAEGDFSLGTLSLIPSQVAKSPFRNPWENCLRRIISSAEPAFWRIPVPTRWDCATLSRLSKRPLRSTSTPS